MTKSKWHQPKSTSPNDANALKTAFVSCAPTRLPICFVTICSTNQNRFREGAHKKLFYAICIHSIEKISENLKSAYLKVPYKIIYFEKYFSRQRSIALIPRVQHWMGISMYMLQAICEISHFTNCLVIL